MGVGVGIGNFLNKLSQGFRSEQQSQFAREQKKDELKFEQDKIKLEERKIELEGRQVLKPGETLFGTGGDILASGGEVAKEAPKDIELDIWASGVNLDGTPVHPSLIESSNRVLNSKRGRVQTLSKDFESLRDVKTFRTFRDQYNKMEATWAEVLSLNKGEIDEKTFGAVDQSIINVYNKMLDPNSVVRESEFARTQEGAALTSKILGYFKRIVEGGIPFTNIERKSLVRMARRLTDAAEQEYNLRAVNYRNRGNAIYATDKELNFIAEISEVARPWQELATADELVSGDVIVPGTKPPLSTYVRP